MFTPRAFNKTGVATIHAFINAQAGLKQLNIAAANDIVVLIKTASSD